jgi:hypothetical protein
MDSRVLSAKLRKLDLKLDRLDRVMHDVHEQVLALDVKVDAILQAADYEEASEESEESEESDGETLGSSSTNSEDSDDSDMSFVVSDHTSDDDTDDPVPAYTSASDVGSSDSE